MLRCSPSPFLICDREEGNVCGEQACPVKPTASRPMILPCKARTGNTGIASTCRHLLAGAAVATASCIVGLPEQEKGTIESSILAKYTPFRSIHLLAFMVKYLIVLHTLYFQIRDGNGAPIPDTRRGFHPLGDENRGLLFPAGTLAV